MCDSVIGRRGGRGCADRALGAVGSGEVVDKAGNDDDADHQVTEDTFHVGGKVRNVRNG